MSKDSIIVFDVTTAHYTLEPAKSALAHVFKKVGLKSPEYGLWGLYEKLPTRSRMETAITAPHDELNPIIDWIVDVQEALFSFEYKEKWDEQSRYLDRGKMLSTAEHHKKNGELVWTEHFITDRMIARHDVTWIHIWWSKETEALKFWDQIESRQKWFKLEDWYRGRDDLMELLN